MVSLLKTLTSLTVSYHRSAVSKGHLRPCLSVKAPHYPQWSNFLLNPSQCFEPTLSQTSEKEVQFFFSCLSSHSDKLIMEETFVPLRGIKNDLKGRLLCYKQDWTGGFRAGFRYDLNLRWSTKFVSSFVMLLTLNSLLILLVLRYDHLKHIYFSFQDFGSHHLYIFCFSNSSNFIWRTTGEKYW